MGCRENYILKQIKAGQLLKQQPHVYIGSAQYEYDINRRPFLLVLATFIAVRSVNNVGNKS